MDDWVSDESLRPRCGLDEQPFADATPEVEDPDQRDTETHNECGQEVDYEFYDHCSQCSMASTTWPFRIGLLGGTGGLSRSGISIPKSLQATGDNELATMRPL